MSYGLLLLRVVVGLAFIGHGTQKLFGWFGGYGPQGTGGFFASQGYRAGASGRWVAVGGRSKMGARPITLHHERRRTSVWRCLL